MDGRHLVAGGDCAEVEASTLARTPSQDAAADYAASQTRDEDGDRWKVVVSGQWLVVSASKTLKIIETEEDLGQQIIEI